MWIQEFDIADYNFKNPITLRIWFKKNQQNRRITIGDCVSVSFHFNGVITIYCGETDLMHYSYFIGVIERFELVEKSNKTKPIFDDYMKKQFSFNFNKIWS